MKKFVTKFLVFCIPFYILVAWFLAFEEYDYFGIRGGSDYNAKPITQMRELLMDNSTNIILGDSRMAHLDEDLIYELSGEHYTNLAFGGAAMNEIISMFYWADEHTDLEKVYICISFYTINGNYITADRVLAANDLVENPINYISDYTTYTATFNNTIEYIKSIEYYFENGEWPKPDTYQPSLAEREYTITEEGYRSDLFEFATLHANPPFPFRTFNASESFMDSLIEIAQYCEEKGIEIIAVFPPTEQTYWDVCINEKGYAEDVLAYKQELLKYFTAIDMEWESDFIKNHEYFYDPLHLYKEYYDEEFTKVLFTDYTPDYVVRSSPY